VLDFTSALYLGFEHSREQLPSWPRLLIGKPAALWEPEAARQLGSEMARLQGCENGLIAPSTLHVFWDVLGWLARRRIRVYVDSGAYPIAVWGAEHAASHGAPLVRFRHGDINHLERLLRSPAAGQPVVITDGFCPACGTLAPLAELLACVRRAAGLLLVDDTQGLGIFGTVARAHPYGVGGGGSLRHAGFEQEEDVLAVSSLAKAFGAPLAVLAGPQQMVHDFEQASETRVHCTPPSMAAVFAGIAALARNRSEGDNRRHKLAELVRRLHAPLAGLRLSRGIFPFQILACPSALELHRGLLGRGIQTVLRVGPGPRPTQIGIVITAMHTPVQVDILSNLLNEHREALCLA
jgi:8-amino-7-oxononanoate synthase